MIKNGYPPSIACGTICASGTLGQIIPPSLVLILLADVLSSAYQQAQLNAGIFAPETVTISDLFAGAIIPGLLLPIIYIFYIKFQKIECSEKYSNDEYIQTENLSLYKYFIPPILLILIVLGSIIFGIATPSEASALGAAGAFFLALYQKKISKIIIHTTAKETIKLTSMVFMILIGATFFSLVFRGLDGEAFIHNLLLVDANDKNFSLIIVLLLMFFLGFILDFIEIIFIIIPLFGPALFSLGFEPVWIGILIAMVLQTSFLTPPFGFALFYLRGVAPKNIPTFEIYKGVYPFVMIQILVIVIIFLYPEIATFLPNKLSN
jgi:tripartite ATP-independent transporter DctM subunit